MELQAQIDGTRESVTCIQIILTLSGLSYKQHDFKSSVQYARQSVETLKALSEAHDKVNPALQAQLAPAMAQSEQGYGMALLQSGQYKEAREALEQCTRAYESILGTRVHAVLVVVLNTLGQVCWELEQFDVATTYLTEALNASIKINGRSSITTGVALSRLGNVARCQRNYDSARSQCTDGLDTLVKATETREKEYHAECLCNLGTFATLL